MVKYRTKKHGSFVGKLQSLTVVDYILILFFLCFAFITFFPIWYVVVGSFNLGKDYAAGGVYFLPRIWSLTNYRYVLSSSLIWQGFLVTIGRTVLATTGHIVVTYMVAHAMSRPYLRFRKFYTPFMLFTMFFGGGFIPYYLVLNLLGLLNNFLVYIIPCLFSVYDMLVFTSFLRSIPEELREAAIIDGAGEFRIAFSLILPLCKPVIATVLLWQVVAHWNNYFDSMYYVTDSRLYSIQYVVKTLLGATSVEGNTSMSPEDLENLTGQTISFAAIVVSVLPITIIYPLLNKQFAKGFMLGSLKG